MGPRTSQCVSPTLFSPAATGIVAHARGPERCRAAGAAGATECRTFVTASTIPRWPSSKNTIRTTFPTTRRRYPVERKFPLFAHAALATSCPSPCCHRTRPGSPSFSCVSAFDGARGPGAHHRRRDRVTAARLRTCWSHDRFRSRQIRRSTSARARSIRDRPGARPLVWALTAALAARALALVLMKKPTVGVPAAVLLAARGDDRVLGIGFGSPWGLARRDVLLIGASGGMGDLLAALADITAAGVDDTGDEVTERAPARRLPARRSRPGPPTHRARGSGGGRRDPGSRRSGHPSACSGPRTRYAAALDQRDDRGVLLGSYHQAYDVVFLLLPAAWSRAGHVGTEHRPRVAGAVLLVAAGGSGANYLATHSSSSGLSLSGMSCSRVTSINGLAMTAASSRRLVAALGARGTVPAANV